MYLGFELHQCGGWEGADILTLQKYFRILTKTH